MTDPKYSVLISVYSKASAEELTEAVNSMLDQTLPTDNIVLVEDGPLTPELDSSIAELVSRAGDIIDIVKLPVNRGLGIALNEGLAHCRHELVARMDSDDISVRDRCEKQLTLLANAPDIDIVSSSVVEFKTAVTEVEREASPLPGYSIGMITGRRNVPASDDQIRKYSRKRSPFNHPAVMFRRSAVIEAGGYSEEYHLFEDYHLWVRMLMKGSKGANIDEALVYMRTADDTYARRGGQQYAKDLLRFHKWLRSIGWSTRLDYITGAVPHALVCKLPGRMRRGVYKLLR